MSKKGYKQTEEHKQKIGNANSITQRGKPKFWLVGKKHTEERRKKESLAHLGKVSGMKGKKVSSETKEKLRLANLGKKQSPETIEKRRLKMIGKVYNKLHITPINLRIRNSLEYKLWRKAVFERDNYQCIWGGKEHGSKLNADHIKPFAHYPELRFAIDNGRTLCIECHRKTDTYGSRNKILNAR